MVPPQQRVTGEYMRLSAVSSPGGSPVYTCTALLLSDRGCSSREEEFLETSCWIC